MAGRSEGWELRIERLGLHRRGPLVRTYGRYVVTIDGIEQPRLSGFMLEAGGPGDNSTPDNGRRIEAGRYPLTTHFRKFVTAGYSLSETLVADAPMPAIRLLETGRRTGILIHPVYPPEDKLFAASVGCLNPTGLLAPEQNADFWDTRRRVIALIDSLRGFQPQAFAQPVPTPIAGAVVVIESETLELLNEA
jgi:hypothetical protein